MFHTFLSSMLIFTSLIPGHERIEFSFGPHYSSYRLFKDDEDAAEKWCLGGELGMTDFIPNIGLKIRGSKLRYDAGAEQVSDVYEYIPLTFCTSFNILPFLKLNWLRLSVETGLGVYFWKGLCDGKVYVLPDSSKMEERDIGFVGGVTLQIRPHEHIGIEFASRYNYIASANLTKYGFYDKDEKIWENGIGLKIIW